MDLQKLFAVAPALRTLDVMPRSFEDCDSLHLQVPINLQELSIEWNYATFEEIKYLLSPMTQLVHLTIIADEVNIDMADGAAWAQLLSKIVTFKFCFTFERFTFTQTQINFDSFRSPFWVDEKKWYVTCDRCDDTDFSLLYSSPYCVEEKAQLCDKYHSV